MSTVDRVRELIAPLVEASGLELVDVEHAGGLLRITLDRVTDGDTGPDAAPGIDLDTITAASEQISDLLDLHDPIPSRYTLEVTSPGLERPLRTPAQFRRFVGSVVAIKTNPDVEGERRIEGELTEADDTGITVAGRRIAYAEIERARTVFQWGPPPRPGKSRRKKATTP